MTILILIIGLSLLIFIHELGHFLVAKRFGLYVEEFGFGFPPKLFSWKKGETVYSINLLPFGGFVKIFGERSDVSLLDVGKEKQIPMERSFASQNVRRRAAIIAAGVVMNFLMGWIILSAIFMIGAQGYAVVTQVAPDSPAALAGFLPGDQLADFEKSADFIAFVKESRGKELSFAVLRSGERIDLRKFGAIAYGVREPGTEIRSDRFAREYVRVFAAEGLFRTLPQYLASRIAEGFGIMGPGATIQTACTSSAQAIGEAFRTIRRGDIVRNGLVRLEIEPVRAA